MAWFRVDDNFFSSRKVLSIPKARRLEAIGLWTTCGAWAAKELTDGFVPAAVVEEFGGSESAIKDLIQNRLWVAVDQGFAFHDWFDYQFSKSEITDKRQTTSQKRSEAGKSGAEARWQNHGKRIAKTVLPYSKRTFAIEREEKEGWTGLPENGKMAKPWQSDGKRIAPTLPYPLAIDKSIAAKAMAKKGSQIADNWLPNDSCKAFGLEHSIDVNFEAEQFRNHAIGLERIQKNWDAAFRVWLGNSVRWKKSTTTAKATSDDWMNK